MQLQALSKKKQHVSLPSRRAREQKAGTVNEWASREATSAIAVVYKRAAWCVKRGMTRRGRKITLLPQAMSLTWFERWPISRAFLFQVRWPHPNSVRVMVADWSGNRHLGGCACITCRRRWAIGLTVLSVPDHSMEQSREAHVSTVQTRPQAPPRFPQADGHCRWSQRSCASPLEGPQAPFRVVSAVSTASAFARRHLRYHRSRVLA